MRPLQRHHDHHCMHSTVYRRLIPGLGALLLLLGGGCAQMPTSGPSGAEVRAVQAQPGSAAVQVVDVDDRIARLLLGQWRLKLFSDSLGQACVPATAIGGSEPLEVSIWEAPPARLYGGVRQPVSKTALQVTQGNAFHALPLRPCDVVPALFQPLSFTALGATGKNEEISFEAQGIALAQALARAGGLVDSRSSPQGVFIFRFEPEPTLAWPRQPVSTAPEGLVPVVYRIDLNNPNSFS